MQPIISLEAGTMWEETLSTVFLTDLERLLTTALGFKGLFFTTQSEEGLGPALEVS